jgi:hypothetical protein
MPDSEQERKAREAHIEKRQKSEVASTKKWKTNCKRSGPAPTRPPEQVLFRRAAERTANAASGAGSSLS